MIRHDLWFILIAATSLVLGVILGIYMGLAHDFSLAPVHAHINLLGWASLALFGLAYRAYPGLRDGRTANLHLVLSGTSGFLMPAGLLLALTQGSAILVIAASIMWLAGAILFLSKMVALARLKP